MISFKQAQELLRARIGTLGTELVPLIQATGRVLRESVTAPRDVPPRDNSALDGYGLRAEDLRGASPESPARLSVVGEIAAGELAGSGPRPGEAVRIMTGAPVPPGVDAVIGVEDTRLLPSDGGGGDVVLVHRALSAGAYVRRAGEDLSRGTVAFSPGQTITPSVLGVLASMGIANVRVGCRPRVAILSTGKEVIEVGSAWREGAIYSSNSYSLRALVESAGAVPVYQGIIPDELAVTKERLTAAFEADVVMTSGGVSMGVHDYVRVAAREIGVEEVFWKVAMKPGKPFYFGLRDSRPLFGLPGNPVSSMMSFEQLVRPVLRRLQGALHCERPVLQGRLTQALHAEVGRLEFVRARAVVGEDGVLQVTPLAGQGSGVLSTLAAANAFVPVAPELGSLAAGTPVGVQLLDLPEL